MLVPAFVLPFAERLRTEWARYWESKAKPIDDPQALAARLALLEADARLEQLRAMEGYKLLGVPFPDEPPLGYPTPERWEELMTREKTREAASKR